MPKGPKGEKRPADVIGNAVHVMRIATGEITEDTRSEAVELGRVGGGNAPKQCRRRGDGRSPRRRRRLDGKLALFAPNKAVRMPPALAANMTDRAWDMADIVKLIDDAAPKPRPRGPYKKLRQCLAAGIRRGVLPHSTIAAHDAGVVLAVPANSRVAGETASPGHAIWRCPWARSSRGFQS